MSAQTAKATIKFRKPVMFHAVPNEMFETGRTAAKKGKAGNNPDEWRGTFRATKDGELYLTPEQIYSCIKAAGKYQKRGRGILMSYIASTLEVVESKVGIGRFIDGDPAINDYDADVFIDVRPVKNPNSRGSTNIRYRITAKEGAEATFTLRWEDSILHASEIHQALIDAGNMEGLGDGRAIGMGRFDVVDFKVV